MTGSNVQARTVPVRGCLSADCSRHRPSLRIVHVGDHLIVDVEARYGNAQVSDGFTKQYRRHGRFMFRVMLMLGLNAENQPA